MRFAVLKGRSNYLCLQRFDEVRRFLPVTPVQVRPQSMGLTAVGETWHIEYCQTPARTVRVRARQPGRILVEGNVDDFPACCAALRRWLARRARQVFDPSLRRLALELGLSYTRLSVKGQRTRWGSCSSARVISLNWKLLFLPAPLLRYALLHELCHLAARNHTSRFWTALRSIDADAPRHHEAMRDGWKHIPAWLCGTDKVRM